MKTKQNNSNSDLKLLIDISCMSNEEQSLFEPFHKMIIAHTYNATDIEFDNNRKRIYLNVLEDETKGTYLKKFDDMSSYRMSANLRYTNLGEFLNKCVNDLAHIDKIYPSLKYCFFKGQSLQFKNLKELEEA